MASRPVAAILAGKPKPLAKVFLAAHPGHDNSGFRLDDFFVILRDDGATLRVVANAVRWMGAK